MKTLSTKSRIIVGVASLLLIATYFLPVWRIDLWAPQYPEGLVMKIWLTKLSGDVEVINGLNHYIGMAHIREEMFPEFTVLPYILGGYILFGLLTALSGSRRLLAGYLSALVLFGIVALIDFWRWGYQYGHNLDPKAPIQVPGMSYQPPVIGYKQLLNFGAYSVPDFGGWIIVLTGLAVAGVTAYEFYFRGRKRAETLTRPRTVLLWLPLLLAAQACSVQPEPIHYGRDNCDHCRMTIVDKKFAAELVTAKGKAFKFDDLDCMTTYMLENELSEAPIQLVADYNRPGELVDARTAVFVHDESLRSPMRGDKAAFSAATVAEQKFPGVKALTWNELNQK
ncbi:hypothetical protein GCM10023189_61080 [Nibrella saemangeumensis]|uniref:Copper chaperone NosL n=1 Tax=Nibrella saemangeumensis TaxID=1084526 RepID=A0ABP8NQG1_9BACT